ncbi:short-chain dehydrogenase [Kaistia algarum]|uniref:SDR family NAD(P)-dependent oxidoreductase n=1 Tax=Kaistia algarum TaxID=2083279 RepID=UPI000CE874BA|nr:SDR family oxidoreductase [Kaistia algarum]MCX5511897.1 SDR family oxidoreductase [Kaistia algarum]PPE80032.1 short-chain dehydrogenase [Kaistia algarum]
MRVPEAFDRVVIITGAASGIGAETARRLAASRTALVLHTRKNEAGLAAVAAACTELGAGVATHLGDLGDPEVPPGLVATARSRFGRVDQIVSNAGQAKRSRFGDLTPEELVTAFDTMPVAFLRLVNAALPDLETSAQGRVVAVSSFVAHIFGTAGLLFPATSAAKAALEALVKALAWQLAPTGATANAVVPGFTRKQGGGHLAATPDSLKTAVSVTPTDRLTDPSDIAATIAFLLSPGARQITGQTLHVNGGLTLP